MNKLKVIKNIVLFLVGFCGYITIEVCFRGHSYIIMGICGGIAVVLLDKLNSKISWDMDFILQGCIGSLLITAMELAIGIISKLYGLTSMWDYSNIWLNFDGIICLPFSLLWIVLSMIAILVADSINYYVFGELPVPYYRVCGRVVFKLKANMLKE